MSEEKRIRITPKPAVEFNKKVGRPRVNPIVKPEDKKPVGRPRIKPVGPGKALGEKRPMTVKRKKHLEKMHASLRAGRERKRLEKQEAMARTDGVRSTGAHLTTTKNVEPEHVANPQRESLHHDTPPAPKPDYNTPALPDTINEGVLSRGLEQDHWHSSYDIPHDSFFFGSHPSGVSYPGGSLGSANPPSGQKHHESSATRGSGTGDITHPGDAGSFFL